MARESELLPSPHKCKDEIIVTPDAYDTGTMQIPLKSYVKDGKKSKNAKPRNKIVLDRHHQWKLKKRSKKKTVNVAKATLKLYRILTSKKKRNVSVRTKDDDNKSLKQVQELENKLEELNTEVNFLLAQHNERSIKLADHSRDDTRLEESTLTIENDTIVSNMKNCVTSTPIVILEESLKPKNNRPKFRDRIKFEETSDEETIRNDVEEEDSDDEIKTDINNMINRNMVPIGDGNASVPSELFKQLNWDSYKSVTKKLLTAVFSNRVLATHSLTGKQSPAFPNTPAKKKLDPLLVNDIVQTVVDGCEVSKSTVRICIRNKCAAECNSFRGRQQKNTGTTGKEGKKKKKK